MVQQGAGVLSDAELLALLLGSASGRAGGVMRIARLLLERFDGLDGLATRRPGELLQVDGIGQARACALAGAFEIARRLARSGLRHGDALTSSEQVHRFLKPRLSGLRQELFLVLALDARNRVRSMIQVAQGSATSVDVHPREVFAPLVRESAVSAIVAHNHPSGDQEPSEDDLALTIRLADAGRLLGIPLLDHLIVGERGYTSMADRGVI